MIVVSHRRNRISELAATLPTLGVEVDVRSEGGRLIVAHDPFVPGEDFERWLGSYRHRLLIVNVKEEGLEERVLRHLEGAGVEDFFFLDQSFPFLIRTVRQGERRCAVRVSEFESVQTALSLAGLADWIWLDCFEGFPIPAEDAARLRRSGFRLCLVSPELHGRTDPDEIGPIRRWIDSEGVVIDAVCTKLPARWSSA